MVDLDILDTIMTKDENGWYQVNIVFNQDFETTFFVKPDLNVSQYNPTEPIVNGWRRI